MSLLLVSCFPLSFREKGSSMISNEMTAHISSHRTSQHSSRITSIGRTGTGEREMVDERSCARDPIYSSIISQMIQKQKRNSMV